MNAATIHSIVGTVASLATDLAGRGWRAAWCAFALCAAGNAFAGEPVRVCADEAGWPPYAYTDPGDHQRIIGASIDLLRAALAHSRRTAEVVMRPWARCLAELEAGTMDVATDATFSDERAAKFLLTQPLYTISSALYYVQHRFPAPPVLTGAADLNKYRFCGLHGYNYSMYPIPAAQLDTGAQDEVRRFLKLRAAHCDFVLGDIEIIAGFVALGKLDLTGIGRVPIPGAKPKAFHDLVSRRIPNAAALVKAIDDGIAKLTADGSYARTFANYGL